MLRVVRCLIRQPSFMAPTADMSGKTVVVTGPTIGGIGYETALALAKFGARVILAARNPASAAEAAARIRGEAPSSVVEHAECDLSRLDTVTSFSTTLKERAPQGVDVLVCNAGALFDRLKKNADGVEMTFAVCALGHHKLIHLLQPRRVIWVSGDVYVLSKGSPDPFVEQGGSAAYFKACLARLLLAREWKKHTSQAGTPMEVVCVHPGVINSEFAKMSGFSKKIAGSILISPELGAQASILTATARSTDIHQDKPLPYYHNKGGWLTLANDDLAMNQEAASKLFTRCDEICGIQRK